MKASCLAAVSGAALLFIYSACSPSTESVDSHELQTLPVQINSEGKLLKDCRGIRDILEDKSGNIWFSSTDYVAVFNGDTIQYFEDDVLPLGGRFHLDAAGGIWIENGEVIFTFKKDGFREYPMEEPKSSEEHPDFWFQKGINTQDSVDIQPGVYHLTNESLDFLPLSIEKVFNYKFLYYPTSPVIQTDEGTLWWSTMEAVFGYSKEGFTTIGRTEMGRSEDERKMGIRGIYIDREGLLWMADNGAGIFTFDGDTIINFTKKYHLDESDTDGARLHRAFSIAEDIEGNMWFGTVYSGIWKFDRRTEKFTNYGREEGVVSDNIWSIYQTQKGQLLFLGETPGAVYRLQGDVFERLF